MRRFHVGDRVFARVAKDRMGAFAQFAVVEEDHAALIPASLDFATAAAIPLAGLTALQALRDELHVARGQRIFIPGGAGGVGSFAIQIAKYFGAQLATTASPRGQALVRQLGADMVIDYTQQQPEMILSGFDGAFDLIGGDTLEQAFAIVRPGATVVSVAGMPEPQTASKDLGRGLGLQALFWVASFSLRRRARQHGARYRYLFMHPSGEDLSELARLVDAGAIEVIVDGVYPFGHIADAMAKLESGRAKGKIVVTMPDSPTARQAAELDGCPAMVLGQVFRSSISKAGGPRLGQSRYLLLPAAKDRFGVRNCPPYRKLECPVSRRQTAVERLPCC